MRFEHEATPIGVDERMALASIDLLTSVIAARSASLRRFDALAIDDRARGIGFAANSFTIENDQGMIDLLEATFVAELRKPAIDRVPRRQIAGQQAPRTARSHHIENAVDDLAHRPCARPSRAIRRRKVGSDHGPFLIGQIALVSVRSADMLFSRGWGPHGNSGLVSVT